MATLDSLPPPPQGQTGITLDQFSHLPPPPAGQTGMTLAQIQGQGPASNWVTDRGAVGNLVANLAAGGKQAFDLLAGSEKAAGADITAALPGSVTGVDKLNKTNEQSLNSDVAFVKAMGAQRAAGKPLTPTQQALYDHILQTNGAPQTTASDLTPAIDKSNLQVAGDFAGVGADALGAGTFTKEALIGDKALTTGLQKAAPTAVTAAKGAIDTAKGMLPTAASTAAKETAKVVDMVSPKLTAKEAAQALVDRGGTKSGILRAIKLNADPAAQRIADTVKQFVPDFNPSKPLVENINATKTAVSDMASKLKTAVVASGKDRIYSFKQLGAAIRGVEKPTLIAADSTLNRAYDLVTNKALEIARSNGGKVSDLFQARKEFDQFVSRQFPNLYSSDTLTPMRSAIKNIRNAMTDFTAEHLPPEIGLRDALTHQSRLLDAVENMSAKAASGAQKEVGTNILQRAGSALKNHPVAGAFGGVAAYEAAKRLPIVGGILP